MSVLRTLLLLNFAAFLAGCAAATPLPQAQENISKKIAQNDLTHPAEVRSEAKTLTPKPRAPKPKPAMPSTASDKGSASLTTPNVGSPEWKKEQAVNERKEQHLKMVIEGICHGC